MLCVSLNTACYRFVHWDRKLWLTTNGKCITTKYKLINQLYSGMMTKSFMQHVYSRCIIHPHVEQLSIHRSLFLHYTGNRRQTACFGISYTISLHFNYRGFIPLILPKNAYKHT